MLDLFHLFHVRAVDLLLVPVSIFVRNHPGIVIGCRFPFRNDGTTIVSVHHVVVTGTGAQGKSKRTGRR